VYLFLHLIIWYFPSHRCRTRVPETDECLRSSADLSQRRARHNKKNAESTRFPCTTLYFCTWDSISCLADVGSNMVVSQRAAARRSHPRSLTGLNLNLQWTARGHCSELDRSVPPLFGTAIATPTSTFLGNPQSMSTLHSRGSNRLNPRVQYPPQASHSHPTLKEATRDGLVDPIGPTSLRLILIPGRDTQDSQALAWYVHISISLLSYTVHSRTSLALRPSWDPPSQPQPRRLDREQNP